MYSEALNKSKYGIHWIFVLSAFILGTTLVLFFPGPALGSLGIVAAGMLAVLLPVWTLYLYAASLFLFQVPLLSDLQVAVPTGVGFVFIASVFLHHSITRSSLRLRSRLPRLLALLALVVLVSDLTHPEWLTSHPRSLVTYLALCASAIAVGLALQTERACWTLVKIFAVGVNVVSALAIYETRTGHYNPLGLFEGQEERAYGLADPNYTAAFIVTLLPFLVALFLCERSPIIRIWAAVSLAFACLAIAMTVSRGGILGVIVAAGAVLILVYSKRKRETPVNNTFGMRHRSSVGRVRVFIMLLLGFVFAASLAPTALWDRLSSYDNWTNPHKESRLRIWDVYLARWRQSPWWGQGLGYVEEREYIPHNTPLQFLVESGVFGLVVFALLNGFAFWEILRARRRFAQQGWHDLSVLSGAVCASLIGFHFTAFFLTSATHKELWFLFGFVVALSHHSSAENIRVVV